MLDHDYRLSCAVSEALWHSNLSWRDFCLIFGVLICRFAVFIVWRLSFAGLVLAQSCLKPANQNWNHYLFHFQLCLGRRWHDSKLIHLALTHQKMWWFLHLLMIIYCHWWLSGSWSILKSYYFKTVDLDYRGIAEGVLCLPQLMDALYLDAIKEWWHCCLRMVDLVCLVHSAHFL